MKLWVSANLGQNGKKRTFEEKFPKTLNSLTIDELRRRYVKGWWGQLALR